MKRAKFKTCRIMLPSKYITKVKVSAKRYNRAKERSINHNSYKGDEDGK